MDKINFTVNGDHYSISGAEVSAHTSLNDFLRSRLQLFGTKAMCREGGCGACVVAAARAHPATGQREVIAVNSCLVAVLSCHEWEITTVEGIGGRRAGYHPAQQRLAERHGSQCGYCSPGWVMSMYSLQASGKRLDEYSLERSFAAHVCRCTGYRPILDTIKSFAHDSKGGHVEPLQDLEELDKLGCLRDSLSPSSSEEWCVIDRIPQDSAPLSLDLMRTEPCPEFESNQAPARWYKPFTIADIFTICNREGPARCRFVAGNTVSGIYPEDTETPIAIDISSVSELQTSVRDQNLVLGAGCTLTEVIATLRSHAQFPGFKYLTLLADHLSKVAHTPVRNVGTLGGNLAIKRAHPEFPSDVALLLQTVGATITVMESADRAKVRNLFVPDFMKSRLRGSLVASVKLPPLSENCLLRTYKIMPRAQSTPALVHAGFLFEVEDAEHNVVKTASVVFSNMGAGCVQATNTEQALLKRSLFKDDTLQAALRALKDELNPVKDPFDASPAFKKALALSLFYKAVLSLAPAGLVSARYLSGAADLVRGVSRGEQKFPTEKEMFPLTEAVPKLEALAQCAGEARYACDVPLGARGLHAAFALAEYGPAKIKAIDTRQAKAIPGVVEVLTARDIPGQNNFIPLDVPWQRMEEEILADKESKYDGQPVAIVVAVDRAVAESAANAVRVQYADKRTPVLTVQDAMNAPDRDKRIIEEVVQEATDRGTDVVHTIKGSYTVPGQYHFTMETQSSAAWPTENGLKLRSATQWMDMIQVAVSRALKLQENQVEIETGAVGGGYGGKASRSSMIACAAAIAAHVLQRPVSLVLSLDANMRAVGSRQLCVADYEVGTNAAGLIQYVDLKYYSNCGHAFNDSAVAAVAPAIAAFYDTARWKLAGYSVLTDTAANTWCRAPSTTEANAIAEHIMERVAHTVGAEPLAVRMLHVKSEHQKPINELVEALKKDSDWDSRQTSISTYNGQNAWKKRALCISLMAYPIEHFGGFPVTVSVYHADGSVLAAHGGIEMGQGINTKLAQVISHELGIPYSTVRIRASDTFVSPNAMASNGSITSECVARAAIAACAGLRARVEGQGTWLERVKRAYDKEVNLKVVGMASGSSLASYSVYGACALEVELDVLTGARNIRRVDLAQDTGRTLSPAIDIGQVEGALCMGLGLWGSAGERVRRGAAGRLAASTWRYAPPGPLDIPEDLRITLRDADTGKNVAPVLRAKATGEPALVLAVSLAHALRAAAGGARAELGHSDHDWLHIDVPCDVEHVLLAMDPQIENFKLK